MNFIQICSQTGVVNYQATIDTTVTKDTFLFGFTGVTGSTGNNSLFVGFSGSNGLLYDNSGNYFGSYQGGVPFNISGYIFPSYHCYFLNNQLTSTTCPRNTGYIESFIYNTGKSISSITPYIWGNPGYMSITTGYISSGNATGILPVTNYDPTNTVRFQLYSGQITVGGFSFDMGSFYSGYFTGTQNYNLPASAILATTGSQYITGTFYTNFGTFTTGITMQSLYNIGFSLFNIMPTISSSGLTGSGQIQYYEYLGGVPTTGPAEELYITLQNTTLNQVLKNTLYSGVAQGSLLQYNSNFSVGTNGWSAGNVDCAVSGNQTNFNSPQTNGWLSVIQSGAVTSSIAARGNLQINAGYNYTITGLVDETFTPSGLFQPTCITICDTALYGFSNPSALVSSGYGAVVHLQNRITYMNTGYVSLNASGGGPIIYTSDNLGNPSAVGRNVILYLKNILFSGGSLQNVSFSGFASGSGYLPSLLYTGVTGMNTKYNFIETGSIYPAMREFQYATGQFTQTGFVIGSGIGSGYVYLNESLTGNIPTGAYPTQFNVSGLVSSYLVTGLIAGTGWSNLFNSPVTGLFSGTGVSLTDLAYATGTGYFFYTGQSTGLYTQAWSGASLFVNQTVATGIVDFVIPITGTAAFSAIWTGSYQLYDQNGNLKTFTSVFNLGTGCFTGLYTDNTGEMYMTGLVIGSGYTGAGFTYSSGFIYSGNWNYTDSGNNKYLICNSGTGLASPVFALHTGTVYSSTLLTANIDCNVVAGTSGYCLLSTIGAQNVYQVPTILTYGNNAQTTVPTNYLANNIWIKHLRPTTGAWLYSVTKIKELNASGLNTDFNVEQNPSPLSINTFFCTGTDLTQFKTGFYETMNYFSNTNLNSNTICNDPYGYFTNSTGYTGVSNITGTKGYDSGVYIRISSQLSNPLSGVFMFCWQTGHGAYVYQAQPTPLIPMNNGQMEGTYSGNLFSGYTFAAESPTGLFTGKMFGCYATFGLNTGVLQSMALYAQTTGTLLTGLQTGFFASGYMNSGYTYTGVTGSQLLDILITPTGAINTSTFTYPISSFEALQYYQLGLEGFNNLYYFPSVIQSGGYNYPNTPSGIISGIITGYSGFGAYTDNLGNIVINYTGNPNYTGGFVFQYYNGAEINNSLSTNSVFTSGTGLTINSNLVTGRTMDYTPNVIGYSIFTGMVNITTSITGNSLNYYSGNITATGGNNISNNFTIYPNSGYYLPTAQTFNAIQPLGVLNRITSGIVTLISSPQVTGYFPVFIGTGIYTGSSGVSLATSPTGLFIGTTYIKTFSGEYQFLTGFNQNILSPVPFTGTEFSGMALVSGTGVFFFQIGKNYGLTGDTLSLITSGYNNALQQNFLTTY